MRVAIWVLVAGAFLASVGVFVPAVRVELMGRAGQHDDSFSLYQVADSRDSVRELLARYQGSTVKQVGTRVLGKVAPRLGGKTRSGVDDVQAVAEALEDISDDDLRTIGTVTTVTLWTLLGLSAVVIVLAFPVNAGTRRLRIAGVVVAATLAAAIGVAIHLVLARVVAEAQVELEPALVTLRTAAYLIPGATVASLLGAIALVTTYARARRELRRVARVGLGGASPGAPPPGAPPPGAPPPGAPPPGPVSGP